LETTIREVGDAVRQEGITRSATLNLAVCDGRQAVVSRYASGESDPPSLYFHTGGRYVCEDDQCRMVDAQKSRRAIMVASEPLTEEDTWQIVPPGSMMLVDGDHGIDFRPL
jgi:predicted glutamine amidotransferase